MDKDHKGIKKMMVVFTAMLVILGISLFNITIIKGDSYYEDGQEEKRRVITTVAARGSITDSNGLPLAYDKTCYNVNFYRDPFKTGEKWRAIYTEIIIETIGIIEKNGNEPIETLNIKRDNMGNFYFDWGIETEIGEDEEEMTDAERQNLIYERETIAERRHKMWCSNMGVSNKLTAAEAYGAIRQRFMLPDDIAYDKAQKVLSVWQEVQNLSFTSYKPVTIAYDVDISTVAEITERSSDLDGMTVDEDYVRTYPHGEVASHAVGYMSKQYDEALEELVEEKGYSADATAGASGIEATMEDYLSSQIGSRAGKQTVEVDSQGKIVKVLEEKAAEPGYDVETTIDYELQKKCQEVLADIIVDIEEQQKEQYDEYYLERDDGSGKQPYKELEDARGGEDKKTKFAATGAIIVLDVNTGQVLALASHPSYDLNLFTGGISQEDYDAITDEDTTPLFNKAISSKAEPGSIFKMVTGYSALMENAISPETRISGHGRYVYEDVNEEMSEAARESKTNPKCWDPACEVNHQNEDIVEGLKDSCNYFFFTLAERTGIDGINKWSDTFGLTSATGIELPGEVTGHVAKQEILYDSTKPITGTDQKTYKPLLVKNALVSDLQIIVSEMGRKVDKKKCEEAAEEMIQLVDGSGKERGPEIRRILREKLDIPETISLGRRYANRVDLRLYEIQWTPLQTILTGIGQSATAVTPIAVARYVAAIANGGTVYECNIVKRIVDSDGNVVEETNPKVFSTLGESEEFLELIQLGMNEVTSREDGGTGADAFDGFDTIEVDGKEVPDLAGKTGTAQVSKIDLENTAWFVGYTPFRDPEIAVVVYVPNGWAGANVAPAAREVMEYYREKQSMSKQAELRAPGSILK